MKQVIIFVIVILIIVFSGLFQIEYLKSTSVYQLSDIEYIKNLIANEKVDLAYENALAFKDGWSNTRKTWSLFVNHSEIGKLDNNITELVSYLKLGNKEEAIIRIDNLNEDFKDIVDSEIIRIENVF